MAYAALDAIDDSIDATKAFLLPFDLGKWLRLVLVVFFVAGGGGGAANSATNIPQFADSAGDMSTPSTGALPEVGLAGIAIVAIIVLIGLFFLVVTPIMEFVFVESLFAQQVHLRRYFSRNVGNGLRLLGFQIVVGLAGLIVFGGIFAVLALAFFGSFDSAVALAGLVTLGLPVFAVYAIVSGLINGLTRVFVVPIMLAEDRGLLSSWSRLWNAMTDEIGEFAVYVVISVILGLGVGVIAGFASLFALLIVGIPVAIVGFGVFAVAGSGIATAAILAIVGVVAIVLYLIAVNLIQAPLQSFLRYYAMLVLGDIAPDLDPIPDISAEIRDDESADAATSS